MPTIPTIICLRLQNWAEFFLNSGSIGTLSYKKWEWRIPCSERRISSKKIERFDFRRIPSNFRLSVPQLRLFRQLVIPACHWRFGPPPLLILHPAFCHKSFISCCSASYIDVELGCPAAQWRRKERRHAVFLGSQMPAHLRKHHFPD